MSRRRASLQSSHSTSRKERLSMHRLEHGYEIFQALPSYSNLLRTGPDEKVPRKAPVECTDSSNMLSAAPEEAFRATGPSGAVWVDRTTASTPRNHALRMMPPRLPGSSYSHVSSR